MRDIKLRPLAKPPKVWMWLILGSLFLLLVNILTGIVDPDVIVLDLFLGYVVLLRFSVLPDRGLLHKGIISLGLVISISVIASIAYFGVCSFLHFIPCTTNQLRANIFGNFFFSLLIVLIWIIYEAILFIFETLKRNRKFRKIK